MKHVKLTLPLVIAFVTGIVGIFIHYIPGRGAARFKDDVSNWFAVIGVIAGVLGIYSMFHLHWTKIRRKVEGWGYSVFFFMGFGLTVAVGVYNGGAWFWNARQPQTFYNWLYDNVYTPAGATLFAMLGFYIASAAFRTFRARSLEATLLLGAAVIVMLGRSALGDMIHASIPGATEWLMAIPNTAAKRGVMFGVSLGAMATSLKIIFGIERTYLGGD